MPDSSEYHIYVTSSLIDEPTRVLKQGDLFAVFNRFGDIDAKEHKRVHGIYLHDTRFVNQLELRIGDSRPLLLSSTVKEDNAVLNVDLTNPDLELNGATLASDSIHIMRSKFLNKGTCYEEIKLRSYADEPVELPLTIDVDGDFFDIFELRGLARKARGKKSPVKISRHRLTYEYIGLDDRARSAMVQFSPVPDTLDKNGARYVIRLEPGWEATITVMIRCTIRDADVPAHESQLQPSLDFTEALTSIAADQQSMHTRSCEIRTSNDLFNRWVARSVADLYMLTTPTDFGHYPYAGTPWYSTVFGRDGLITAYQCLWANPELARGVLTYLAHYQAKKVRAEQDAEPGKILHELRHSEMALLGEVPFRCYYGSVDSTLLYIILAGAYYERTADDQFLEFLWPTIERALHWIENHGDRDGDGYVEYGKHASDGLDQQGWKDSHDSIFHADGTMAKPPIALCEVQAYLYGARNAIAMMARTLQMHTLAEDQLQKAERLRIQFERDFWSDELNMYAIALDGEKKRCDVRSSNAGQCLLTGIVSQSRALDLTRQLMSDDFYSGWGIRTIASSEARYNPMAYHNGSIWPHDNALIAMGMARYGFQKYASRLLHDLYIASRFFDLHRIPELFCGFSRRPGEGPTLYPVACSPQAWAAASVYLMLQAILGLRLDARESTITFHHPCLPMSLQEVVLRNLTVAGSRADVRIIRHTKDVSVEVIKRTGNVKILVVK